MDEITVEAALQKGTNTVIRPFSRLLLGGFLSFIIVPIVIKTSGILAFIPGIIILIAAFIYRSIAITKWKIWAFNNVRNVHELKRKAIRDGIIGKDGSEWMRWQTLEEKALLKQLEAKFEKSDIRVFVDDSSVPEVTEIFYSERREMSIYLLAIAFVTMGCIVVTDYIIWGILSLGLGTGFIYYGYKTENDNDPEIVVNSKGIGV
jgi:hypothetical protein